MSFLKVCSWPLINYPNKVLIVHKYCILLFYWSVDIPR